jgi:2-keto-4-pentenoate hydratase/2-oxohepta-3-ene-1,7-dioic acid hydratase in catechol pathway
MTRRDTIALAALAAQSAPSVERYIRFQNGPRISWGRLDGELVTPLSNAPYLNGRPLGGRRSLKGLKLLPPADPPKVLAVGLNYRSHIGNRAVPKEPEIFTNP